MEPFVERMVKEYYDLKEKATKLYDFLKSDKFLLLSEDEQYDITEQYQVIGVYMLILERRLKRQGYDVSECNGEIY